MRKLVFALAAFSLVAIAGCNSAKDDPASVLTQFFTALSKKDIKTARTLATKDSESMLSMMEMGMNMDKGKDDSPKFSPADMEFGEVKIDGDKAIIPVKEKKTGESMNYTLKKEDGKWKVAFDKSTMMDMGNENLNEEGIEGINATDSLDKIRQELDNLKLDSLHSHMDGMPVDSTTNK